MVDERYSEVALEHEKTRRPPRFLTIGFASVIGLIALIAAFSLVRTQGLQAQLETVVDQYNHRANLLRQMRIAARERVTVMHSAANKEDPFEREELLTLFGKYGETFLKAREQLIADTLSDWELTLLAEHRKVALEVAPKQRRVMSMVNDERLDEARRFLVSDVEPIQAAALAHLDRYWDRLHDLSEDRLAYARTLSERTITLLGLLAGLGILASLIIAYTVHQRIQLMLSALSDARDNLEHKVAERTQELQIAHDEMDKLAHYDTLTGLPNRRLFYETLNMFLPRARRHSHFAALLFIDLDGFKGVNDAHGHDYGDELLRQVADRLRDSMRAEDMVARLGGDEFTIILGDMNDPDAAEIVARKVIHALQQPFDVFDQAVNIGSSIGIALFPTHAEDRDGLIKAADDMMYAVKKAGKNNYRVYRHELRN